MPILCSYLIASPSYRIFFDHRKIDAGEATVYTAPLERCGVKSRMKRDFPFFPDESVILSIRGNHGREETNREKR